jgi:hypothetical protein
MTPAARKAIPAMVTQLRVKLLEAGRVGTNASLQPSQDRALASKSLLHWGHCFFIVYQLSSDCMMSF